MCFFDSSGEIRLKDAVQWVLLVRCVDIGAEFGIEVRFVSLIQRGIRKLRFELLDELVDVAVASAGLIGACDTLQ